MNSEHKMKVTLQPRCGRMFTNLILEYPLITEERIHFERPLRVVIFLSQQASIMVIMR